LLEKFLRPYKSITAHALLCHVELLPSESISDHPLAAVDVALSRLLLDGAVLISTASLSPLPLMGLPGWWRDGDQNQAFYEDSCVFRLPPIDFRPAPIFPL